MSKYAKRRALGPLPNIRIRRLLLGRHGRVVIPADIRKAMGLSEGQELVAALDERGRLLMSPASAAERELWEIFSGTGPSLSKELLRDRRREARREAKS